MNVREIAYASLLEICKDNGYSNIIVSKAIRSRQFNDRDRRFIRNSFMERCGR